MRILDNIKDSAKKYVNDNKDEFTKKAEEFIKDKVPNLKDDILDKVEEYLNTHKEKITTKEGIKAVNELQKLIDKLQGEDHKDKELTVEETKKLSNFKDKLKEEYEKSNK